MDFKKENFDPTNLREGLRKTNITFNEIGCLFSETTTNLGDGLVEMISNLGIQEIDHVSIVPMFDGRNGQLVDIQATAYFNTNRRIESGSRNIYRRGKSGGNSNTIDLIAQNSTMSSNGSFETTDLFKKVMSRFALNENNINIQIDKRYRDIAIVELHFPSVMMAAMDVDEKSNYNIMYISGQSCGSKDRPDYRLLMAKVIDVNNRRPRKSNIDYSDFDRRNVEMANRRSGRN